MGDLESAEGDGAVFQVIGEELPGGGIVEQPLRRKNTAEHLVLHVPGSKQTQRYHVMNSRIGLNESGVRPHRQPTRRPPNTSHTSRRRGPKRAALATVGRPFGPAVVAGHRRLIIFAPAIESRPASGYNQGRWAGGVPAPVRNRI